MLEWLGQIIVHMFFKENYHLVYKTVCMSPSSYHARCMQSRMRSKAHHMWSMLIVVCKATLHRLPLAFRHDELMIVKLTDWVKHFKGDSKCVCNQIRCWIWKKAQVRLSYILFWLILGPPNYYKSPKEVFTRYVD